MRPGTEPLTLRIWHELDLYISSMKWTEPLLLGQLDGTTCRSGSLDREVADNGSC